jgi:probable HAF family extracellular repeat protein
MPPRHAGLPPGRGPNWPDEPRPPRRISGRCALGLNNSDQVITTAYNTAMPSISHAFLWQDGRWRDLGTLRGGTDSRAADINDRGQMVGTEYEPYKPPRALLWQNNHSPVRELDTSSSYSEAHGINTSGDVRRQSVIPVKLTHG